MAGDGVVPVSEQRADRSEQEQRLVEHGVVSGFGDLDDWGDPAESFVHRRADVVGDESVLGLEQRQSTRDVVEVGERDRPHPHAELFEDAPVELPLEATVGGAERMTSDVIHHVIEVVILRGNGPETGDGFVDACVGARMSERLAQVVRADLGVGFGDGRIAHDDAGDRIGVARGGGDGDESTHAVTHDDRRSADPAGVGGRDHLVGPLFEGVLLPVRAVAVTGEVHRHHPELLGERGGYVRPPVRVRTTAVHEHQATGVRLAPREVVDRPVDVRGRVLEWDGEGATEPVRCVGERLIFGVGHGVGLRWGRALERRTPPVTRLGSAVHASRSCDSVCGAVDTPGPEETATQPRLDLPHEILELTFIVMHPSPCTAPGRVCAPRAQTQSSGASPTSREPEPERSGREQLRNVPTGTRLRQRSGGAEVVVAPRGYGAAVIESVRGVQYGRTATDALAAAIGVAQDGDPLAPVTVIVPSNGAGLAARRVLGATRGLANVGFLTPYAVAEKLGGPRAAATGQCRLTQPMLVAAIRQELRADPGPYAPVATHVGTERAIARRYGELSRARPETLARLRRAGSPRARALVDVVDRVRVRLEPFPDEGALALEGLAAVKAGDAAVAALGAVIVHLIQPLAPALRDLIAAVTEARSTKVIVGLTGDADADADVRAECDRLGVDLTQMFDHDAVEVSPPTGTEIITASDVDEEVRAVIRRVLELAETGVPFDRMAVLSPTVEPYARVVDAQLSAAGIAHNGPAVRLLVDTMAGRMLDRVLRLVGAEFARHELVALFASVPMQTPDGASIPIDRWDLISRRAGVVDGDGWAERLEAYASDLMVRADDRAEAGTGGEQQLRADARTARALAAFVADLRLRLGRLEQATGWSGRAQEARSVVAELLDVSAGAEGWPEAEREALEAVDALLDQCERLDAVEPDPSFATFASTVTNELRSPVGRIGRYGEGVFCGPIGAGVGLDLDAVFVVGLAEGIMPSARREDALLAEADRTLAVEGELATRDRSRSDQRRGYLAALAAGAHHRVLSFARGDLRSARERLASRYLLETASALAGERVYASGFDDLGAAVGVDAVASFAAAMRRVEAAATATDRDLGTVAAYVDAGGDVESHPLVTASVVGTGIEAVRGRASSALTRWDGNIATVAGQGRSPGMGEVVSATRLESWSTCPFRYFLTHVLAVPVEEEPERLLELSARERGTLVHAVLERFMNAELAKPVEQRVPAGKSWPRSAVIQMREIVTELMEETEAKGLTGKAVLWALHREEIESDVVQFLIADSIIRVEQGVIPESVEFPFGFGDAPPVEITVPSGAIVKFRGRADRIDRRPDGTRVVLDYKTGKRPTPPDGCAQDPVWGGARLQLPLYAEAARQRLGVDSVESAYWYISERGGFARDEVELNETTGDRFRTVVGQIVEGIDRGIFPAVPGDPDWFSGTDANCAFCDFDDLCPSQRAAQADAKDGAPELAVFHALKPEVEA